MFTIILIYMYILTIIFLLFKTYRKKIDLIYKLIIPKYIYIISKFNNMNKYIDNDFDFLFKIVILGDSGVGKSNIISKFAKNEFSIESKSTIGVEFHTKIISLNEKKIKIQFWDTAGQERYRCITSSYYKGAHGIIVVYDITNHLSFERVSYWIDEIYKNVMTDIPILLVGNKSDLDYKRNVLFDNGFQFANKYNLSFIEMSAMVGTNIEIGIQKLVKNIYEEFIKKNSNKNNINTNSKININLNENKLNKNSKNKFKNENNCC